MAGKGLKQKKQYILQTNLLQSLKNDKTVYIKYVTQMHNFSCIWTVAT